MEYLVVTIEDSMDHGGAWGAVYRASSLEEAKKELKRTLDEEWCAEVGGEPLTSKPGYRDGDDTYYSEDGTQAWYTPMCSTFRRIEIIGMPNAGERKCLEL